MSDVVRGDDGIRRCRWGANTLDYAVYHDTEWGRPVVDDTHLYEKLCLEGFQSGLAWLTILRKRDELPPRVQGIRTRSGRPLRQTRRRPAAARPVDRSSSGEDRGGDRERRRDRRGRRAPRFAGDAVLVVRTEAPASTADVRRRAREDARVASALEGAPAARVPLRRSDDCVRNDAGRRDRERPPRGLRRPLRMRTCPNGLGSALTTRATLARTIGRGPHD